MLKLNVTPGIVLALLILLGVFAPNCVAQASTADDPLVTACEKAVDEVRWRRVENEGLKQQIVLLQERDKLRDQYEANQAEQISFWKEAATSRKDALGIDDRIERIRLEQLSEYRSENARLRDELARMGRSRTRWLMVGTAVGALGGALAH